MTSRAGIRELRLVPAGEVEGKRSPGLCVLRAFVSYDHRLEVAARQHGLVRGAPVLTAAGTCPYHRRP